MPVNIDRLNQPRSQFGTQHLRTPSPCALVELQKGLSSRIGGVPAATRLLTGYKQWLSPAMIRATGRDRPPHAPLVAVVA